MSAQPDAVRASLRPGDVLLYSGKGLFSTLIKIKTWSRISHVEVYDGYGQSVASRDGQGVGRYGLRSEDLVAIMRPRTFTGRGNFNVLKARAWFATVDGQAYDWLGLLAFLGTRFQGGHNDKMFCSEFATRFLRAGGFDPFNGYDADGIAPGEFLKSSAFTEVYSDVESAA